MATATLISAEEYLAKTYRPDREWIDGELRERNVGEFDHGRIQTVFARLIGNREREWNVHVVTEQRVQVSQKRFRVPDVCVISRDHPREQIITRAPLICIEVLSKDDLLSSLEDRIDDYLAMGVPDIWIVDPVKRRVYICGPAGLNIFAGPVLAATSCPVSIPLEEVYAFLD